MEGLCAMCSSKAVNKCSNCQLVFYCSKEHQKKHWKQHKSNCIPVIVKEDAILGRHLIASKNIKEYHIVFKEKPLIVGPSQITVPVCLGCHKAVTESTSRPCDRCGWPVCNEHCQDSPNHTPECVLTVKRGDKVHIKYFEIPHPNYQCITAVRCIYQKKANPYVWKKLMTLESHCKERKGTEKWHHDYIQIAQFIKRFFKLENEISDDEIMKVCGVIQVNGHEVPLTEPSYVAIYNMTSMFEHNCKANCSKSFTNHGEILIVAGIPISEGDNLSICYTDPMWGTANRLHHLMETKFFQCSCARCSDPTEFGTMFSALRCQKSPCKGFVLPKSFLSSKNSTTNDTPESAIIENPKNLASNDVKPTMDLDEGLENKNPQPKPKTNGSSKNVDFNNTDEDEAENEEITYWSCDVCGSIVTEHYVNKLMEHVGRDLTAMEKGDCESCLRFLQHYGKYLHHNHYYMIDVTLAMAQLIGQDNEGGLSTVTDERLELKMNTCKQMVDFLEKLVPADVRTRGGVLFELHAAIAEHGRRRAARTGEGPGILIKHLTESKEMLEKSIQLLEHEPDDFPEGKIKKQAKLNVEEMIVMLRNLHAFEIPMSM